VPQSMAEILSGRVSETELRISGLSPILDGSEQDPEFAGSNVVRLNLDRGVACHFDMQDS
jgi:hypothetical protein